VKEGAEIQTKGIGNLLNEIIAENFPTLCNSIDSYVQETLQTPNTHNQKRTIPCHIITKMSKL
jgi:hypothetical protein